MSVFVENMYAPGQKFCLRCRRRKAVEDFPVHKNGRVSNYCTRCAVAHVGPPPKSGARNGNLPYHMRSILRGARQRSESSRIKAANTRNYESVIPFDITESYLLLVYEKQEGRCALSGRKMTLGEADSGLPDKDAMSLDRIIPALGYVRDNVRLITHQVNIAKGRFNDEDLIRMAQDVMAHQKNLDNNPRVC